MIKWLVITTVALSFFLSIIIGLGYLLENNEQQTRALVTELNQQQSNNSANERQDNVTKVVREAAVLADNSITNEKVNQLILDNLTCISDNQCKVIYVDSQHCQVAVNLIGASLVKKYRNESRQANICQQLQSATQAVCQDNLCQIKPSSL